ncbi:MAG: hypothetical protein IKT57_01015 [Clostridia bacterium]|nr:hypothetical protein [Clostridia bacterium]
MDTIVVEFRNAVTGQSVDLEIPLFITARELIDALNDTYNLGIDMNKSEQVYLQAENPYALIKGDHKLSDYRLGNSTILHFIR